MNDDLVGPIDCVLTEDEVAAQKAKILAAG